MANRLAGETSPYLQQHADNPVAWWPWGDEAFAEARRRDVPVFLSIGYSTCHWCHVMAHESFEDDDVAAAMNEAFVCIKVDREERPDVDHAYMAACQAMTGRGGWPLTALLDHDRRAWFAGTYFPRASRGHMIGMTDLVPRLAAAWRDDRDAVLADAAHVVRHLQRAPEAPSDPDPAWPEQVLAWLDNAYDETHGGFGGPPKFPTPHVLRFALDHAATRDAALRTLEAIDRGGIHDHVGGGFHRYSTDAEWRLPHFEKMLYDQAGLLDAYAEAWRVTGRTRWAEVCRDIVRYLLRDLRADDGAFFAAEDADSDDGRGHHREGAFYVWTLQEVEEVLGDEADAFAARYDVHADGNHRDEATGDRARTNILMRQGDTVSPPALEALRRRRDARPRPHRDEKVLADWNGLAIAAIARAATLLDEPAWTKEALRAARAVQTRLGAGDGLLHVARRGGGVPAFLADHAAMGTAHFALFEATQDAESLAAARADGDAIRRGFQDAAGRLHASRQSATKLPGAGTPGDGAVPGPIGMAIDLLGRLALATAEPEYEDAAWRALRGAAPDVARAPPAHVATVAAAEILAVGTEIVVTGKGGGARALLATARAHAGAGAVILHAEGRGVRAALPWLADFPAETAAYVCRDHACERPVHDGAALEQALDASAG